jgi:hypothetical protein
MATTTGGGEVGVLADSSLWCSSRPAGPPNQHVQVLGRCKGGQRGRDAPAVSNCAAACDLPKPERRNGQCKGARAAGAQRRWRVVRGAAAAKKGEVGSLGVRVNRAAASRGPLGPS